MTGSEKALNHVKVSVEFQKIKFACGNSHPVQRKGDVTFHFPTGEVKKIEDVLYVPSLHKKFLSVGSLIDKGLITIFMLVNVFCLISKELKLLEE